MRASNRVGLTALGLSLAGAACSAESEDTARVADGTSGAFPATSAKLDAIGTIRIDTGARTRTCTGTLIAPNVVLTAEHCLIGAAPEKLKFVVGAASAAPKRLVGVSAVAFENTVEGGVYQRGSDIAVLQLVEPITGVRPLSYAPFDAALGKSFVAVGL